MKLFFAVVIALSGVVMCHHRASGQWVKTNGPIGITTSKFLKLGNTLYVGTRYAGVFKSYDNGTGWQLTGTGLEHNTISCLAADNQYIYAGATYGQLYRSADSGQTWQQASNGLVDLNGNEVGVKCITIAAGYVWIGSVGNGVYRSADHGDSWQAANGGALTELYILDLIYKAPNLIASTSSYQYSSDDLGNTWNVHQDNTQFWPLCNYWFQGDTMLAATLYGTGHIFRSTDGGGTWANIQIDTVPNYIARFQLLNDTIYAGAGSVTYFSADWGQTWNKRTAAGRIYHPADFLISNSRMLSASYGTGVYSSDDHGENWSSILANFPPTSYIRSMLTINNKVYAAAVGEGVYTTTDHGNSWAMVAGPLDSISNTLILSMLNPAPGIILSGTANGLFRSADNGLSWQHITNGLTDPAGQNPQVGIQSLEKAGSNLLAATNVGIFYSTDLGLNWTATNASTLAGPVFAAFSIAAHGNVVCAAASTGVGTGDGIYRSVDYGVSWFFSSQEPDVYLVSYAGSNRFVLSTLFGGISVSSDNGLNFFSATGFNSPQENYSNDFEVIGNHVFAGNFQRVFHSTDTGDSFTPTDLSPTWPNESAYALTHDDTYLYAGTGDAVWRRPLSDFGISSPTTGVNHIAKQEDITVAPNPSWGAFTVKMPAGLTGPAFIRIVNMSGSCVVSKQLDDAELQRHEVDMNVAFLPAGDYILEVSAAGYAAKQKITQLRR